MAKLTARNNHALREYHVTYPEGCEVGPGDVLDRAYRKFYVLRSDGAVLTAWSSPDAPTAYDRKRSGYTVFGFMKGWNTRDELIAKFVRGHDKLADRYATERPHDGIVVSPVVVK